ncbi:MAG: class A sortase [Bacillota bacterium]|nr:class A sortase [Bacillota bacterium]
MIKKILSAAAILSGILILMLPHITNVLIKNKSKSSIDYIESVTTEDLSKNQERKAEFDFASVKDVDVNSTLLDISKINNNLIIGQLIIPDLNMNLPIIKGVSKVNLLAGAATMKDGQVMGKGNFSLAGHKMKSKGVLFGSLMDIKKGSIIKLTDKKTVYEYVVYETLVVPDTEFHMISDDLAKKRGKPVVTLMTCYYSSKTGKRFFAVGELVKEYRDGSQ